MKNSEFTIYIISKGRWIQKFKKVKDGSMSKLNQKIRIKLKWLLMFLLIENILVGLTEFSSFFSKIGFGQISSKLNS